MVFKFKKSIIYLKLILNKINSKNKNNKNYFQLLWGISTSWPIFLSKNKNMINGLNKLKEIKIMLLNYLKFLVIEF